MKNSSLKFGTTTMFVTTFKLFNHGVARLMHGLLRKFDLDM
jgi:hypothetical protein